MYSNEDWKTDEMARAEHGLDDAVEQAYRDMYAADDVLDEIAANDERRAVEYAEMCREYAHRDDVSPAWKTVIEKVNAGELTWHDIASGDAMDHPAVRAAVAADNQLRQQQESGTAARDTGKDRPDKDTYFDEFTVYRKRKR